MKAIDKKMEDLRAALKEARASSPREPRKRHGAIRQAVAANLDDLLAMREEGFSEAEIATIFRAKGFVVTAGTLKTYLNALRVEKNGPQRLPRIDATPKAKKRTASGRKVGRVAAAGKPSENAVRLAAADGPTIASKALGHRLDDDV